MRPGAAGDTGSGIGSLTDYRPTSAAPNAKQKPNRVLLVQARIGGGVRVGVRGGVRVRTRIRVHAGVGGCRRSGWGANLSTAVIQRTLVGTGSRCCTRLVGRESQLRSEELVVCRRPVLVGQCGAGRR